MQSAGTGSMNRPLAPPRPQNPYSHGDATSAMAATAATTTNPLAHGLDLRHRLQGGDGHVHLGTSDVHPPSRLNLQSTMAARFQPSEPLNRTSSLVLSVVSDEGPGGVCEDGPSLDHSDSPAVLSHGLSDASPRSFTREMLKQLRHKTQRVGERGQAADSKTLMAIRLQVLNSPIFDHVLRLATAGVTVGATQTGVRGNHSLELAFVAVDILLQCIINPDIRVQLGASRSDRIKGVLQKVLFGHDFGLAVLGGKGLIAVSALHEHLAARAAVQPMTFRKAIRMVVLLRVFTRVRRRKEKKGPKDKSKGTCNDSAADGASATGSQPSSGSSALNMQRTMRVI
eukprot:COSAG02_NODE_7286_length_3084_cov_6.649702_3_plen_341_part_00